MRHCHCLSEWTAPRAIGRNWRKLREQINEKFIAVGLDGNRRFCSVGQALSFMTDVLGMFGIEPDEVFSAWTFRQPAGQHGIRLAWSNPTDPFSPVSLEEHVVSFSWYTFANGTVEAIAYVSI